MSERAEPHDEILLLEPPTERAGELAILFGSDAEPVFRRGVGPSDGKPPAHRAVVAAGAGGFVAGAWVVVEGAAASHAGVEPAGHARGDRAVWVASVRQLVVKPEARGRGLAGKLLRRAESIARAHGCVAVRSTAGWGCPDHRRMYDRLGFAGLPAGASPYLVAKPLGPRPNGR